MTQQLFHKSGKETVNTLWLLRVSVPPDKEQEVYDEHGISRKTRKSQWGGLRKWEATTQAAVGPVC